MDRDLMSFFNTPRLQPVLPESWLSVTTPDAPGSNLSRGFGKPEIALFIDPSSGKYRPGLVIPSQSA
jgi:hypothetical protein